MRAKIPCKYPVKIPGIASNANLAGTTYREMPLKQGLAGRFRRGLLIRLRC